MKPVIGLVATCPREAALLQVSIPSIARQRRLPDALVVVSDKHPISTVTTQDLQRLSPFLKIHHLSNNRASGAAGCWNRGLDFICQHWPSAYVAIIDDDDTWDVDHLATCEEVARDSDWPDLVISGLRMSCGGSLISRVPPVSLCVDEFLIGNPGWQGSNTFADIGTLQAAGGFTDGLTSCNDRDLAIRVLSLEKLRVSFTGRFTSTWNFNSSVNSLSNPGPQKQSALRHFFAMHGHRMTPDVKRAFLGRCMDLFGVSETDFA
jgi:glycosyltransferase involved in cell wall biosynthesis